MSPLMRLTMVPWRTTGSMKVEIDDEDFPPMEINDKTRVKLTGEVDRDLVGREIDVEFVEVIK